MGPLSASLMSDASRNTATNTVSPGVLETALAAFIGASLADSGALLLAKDGDWLVVARADSAGQIQILPQLRYQDSRDVAATAVERARNTGECTRHVRGHAWPGQRPENGGQPPDGANLRSGAPADLDSDMARRGARSLLCVPLQADRETVGLVYLESERDDCPFHDDAMIRLSNLGPAIAQMIKSALQHEDDVPQLTSLIGEVRRLRQFLDGQQKMAALGKLTAALAHEINNPTDFVNGSSRNLQRDLKDFEAFLYELAGDDADPDILAELRQRMGPLYEHIKLILDGVERIRAIVRDIRSVSHTSAAEFIKVEITKWLASTINLVRPSYDSTVEFATDFRDPLYIECLPNRLSQVFMNIVVNACNAMLERYGTESGRVGQLTVEAWREEERAFIAFRDNGGGIPEAIRAKIFDPFFSTRKMGKGTGLGLAISQDIMRRHGGDIRVESQLGNGTCFTLILPTRQSAAHRDASALEA